MATFPDFVYEAQKNLRKAEIVAEVLKLTSLLEEDLDFTLALYFCGPGRHFIFMEVVSSTMQFSAKLRILESIPARKNLKSRVQAVAGLRRFQRARNMVAHPVLLRPSKVQSLCEDGVSKAMVINFPSALTEEFRRVRRSLDHLTRSREWKPNSTAKKPGKIDQLYNKFYRNTYA